MYAYITEFIGTFIFLAVILAVGEPIPIVVALLAAIYFGGSISGGHFNPAVSLMMLAKGTLPAQTCVGYILAQVLGGLSALLWYNNAHIGSRKR